MSELVYVGQKVSGLTTTPKIQYTGVRLYYDDEHYYLSGTDENVLEIDCPWGTQNIADSIWRDIENFSYVPYETEWAIVDPAAELGDAVTVGGVFSGIYSNETSYSALMDATISAPQENEVDSEYTYQTKSERKAERQYAEVTASLKINADSIATEVSERQKSEETINSKITQQAGQIEACVTKEGGDAESFSWSLTAGGFSLKATGKEVFKASEDGAEVTGVIKATSGKIGKFNVGDAIWNEIDNFANSNGKSKGVYLGSDGIRLGKNFSVDDSGNVNANNMKLTGTLNVGGTDITAENLRSGAQSAVDNGGYWSGGAGGGYNFINSASEGGSYYSPFFRATQISCDSIGGSTATFSKLVARDSFYLGSVTPLKLISKASASFVVGY